MEISRLSKSGITASDAEDINSLLGQLTDHPRRYTYRDIKKIIKQKKIYVYVAAAGPGNRIVGMAMLKIDDGLTFTQYYNRGYVGDVVVDEKHRGRGIAKALILRLISLAKERRLSYISLTSNPNNPKRAGAIKMYESLGFKLIGQVGGNNYYRMYL